MQPWTSEFRVPQTKAKRPNNPYAFDLDDSTSLECDDSRWALLNHQRRSEQVTLDGLDIETSNLPSPYQMRHRGSDTDALVQNSPRAAATGATQDWYMASAGHIQAPRLRCPMCQQSSIVPLSCGHVMCVNCAPAMQQQMLFSIGICPLCSQAGRHDRVTFSYPIGGQQMRRDYPGSSLPTTESTDDSHLDDLLNSPIQSPDYTLSSSTEASHRRRHSLTMPNAADSTSESKSRGISADFNIPNADGQLDWLDELEDILDLSKFGDFVADKEEPVKQEEVAMPRGQSTAQMTVEPKKEVLDVLDEKPVTITSVAKAPAKGKAQAKPQPKATSTVAPATPLEPPIKNEPKKPAPAKKQTQTKAGGTRTKRKRRAPTTAKEMNGSWTQVDVQGELPEPRYDCGFAACGKWLVVVGGIVGKIRTNDLYVLDTSAGPPKWSRPAVRGQPPDTGNLLQTFVLDETVYVIGGTRDGKFLTEVHAVDLSKSEWSWERLEIDGQPPCMRYWYSVAVLDRMAIIYGGYGHPHRLNDTFALRFDVGDKPKWVQLDPKGDLPGVLSTHSVCVYQEKMYIFGGYKGKSRCGNIYSFHIDKKVGDDISCTWEYVETFGKGPSPRYTHSSAMIGSKMIIYGGNSGCLKGDVYLLELGSDFPTWHSVRSNIGPLPREWHRAVVYEGAMYVFGGHTAIGNGNLLYKMELEAQSF